MPEILQGSRRNINFLSEINSILVAAIAGLFYELNKGIVLLADWLLARRGKE